MFEDGVKAAETPLYAFARSHELEETVRPQDEAGWRTRRFASVCASLCASGCAWAVAGLGAIIVVGRMFGLERVTVVFAGSVGMKANTAFSFLLLGAALVLRLRKGLRWESAVSLGLAAAVLCCSVLTLVEDAFGMELRIGQMLIVDPVQHASPGRVAYLAAINCCVAALSVMLLGGGRQAKKVSAGAAYLLGIVALVSIVGSAYGVTMFYGLQIYAAMALQTATGFLVLSAGLALADEDSALARLLRAEERGGVMFRRALPWVIVVPVLLGWVFRQPRVSLGEAGLGMAWLAVTLVTLAVGALMVVAQWLTREERERKASELQGDGVGERASERERMEQRPAPSSMEGLTVVASRRPFEVEAAGNRLREKAARGMSDHDRYAG